jgi:hypothetical protein
MVVLSVNTSKRELVMSHVWDRTNVAWTQGHDKEACDLDRLHGILKGLTNEQYEEIYEGCDEADL